MHGDTKGELKARLSTLRHIRAFVDMNIKARREELKELRNKKMMRTK